MNTDTFPCILCTQKKWNSTSLRSTKVRLKRAALNRHTAGVDRMKEYQQDWRLQGSQCFVSDPQAS